MTDTITTFAEKLQELFSSSRRDEEKIAEVIEIYNQIGIQQLTEKAIQIQYDKARESLLSVNVDPDKKHPLEELLEMLLKRNK